MAVKTYSTKAGTVPEGDLRSVPCPLCGATAVRPLWQCEGFAFSRCACGLVRQEPQPSPGSVLRRYAGEYCAYEEENEAPFLDLMLKALADIGFDRLAAESFARATAERRAPRFLDVGCATGSLIGMLRGSGWDARGVEVDAESARAGASRHGAPIFAGTLEEACFSSGSFDVVFSSHTIEHLNDPRPWIREIGRILRPGGFFICITPNTASFQCRLFGASWRSAIWDHLYLFSRKTLSSLAESEGFSLRALESWGGLARGTVPAPVKGVADRLAKLLNTGDVMVALFVKPASGS